MSGDSLRYEIISEFDSLQTNAYVSMARTVIILYDYLLTLGREVDLFWSGSSKSAPILFHSIRYLSIVFNILLLARTAQSVESCGTFVILYTVLEYLQYLPLAADWVRAFSGMRAFALTGGHWFISAIVFVFSLIPMGANFFTFSLHFSGRLVPNYGCAIHLELSKPRTGIMYLLFLILSGIVGSQFAILILPLSNILTWRFLIDLQEANHRTLKLASDQPLHLSNFDEGSLTFARAIGSIGATINPDIVYTEEADELNENSGEPSSMCVGDVLVIGLDTDRERRRGHGDPEEGHPASTSALTA
ncbi:hypothetical protein L226DRAFT_527161 [Lentinus tigrinus ALCF2SS1-7]|uniref:DUF6533 domain-containing protein n=1 Tax=Lentinus tigrinus ALCF2SS1-6 TaxID=1328759 RepID=A0A5C2RSA0_9APHY|nr:hypothetical protein L227DRAFT_568000 [Lentinus tigrinus ALCF2SS1-6]RPD68578.1 hypothetical protein L226DRAFT_527161 [Lentinus tigrinus ALCF2SS1-7]